LGRRHHDDGLGGRRRTVLHHQSSLRQVGTYSVNLALSDGTTVYYNSGIAVYDPARTLTGSGTFSSPAGSCTLSAKCAGASTGTFSLSASYAKGATKPTVAFSFSATGVTFTATSADWSVAGGGTAALSAPALSTAPAATSSAWI